MIDTLTTLNTKDSYELMLQDIPEAYQMGAIKFIGFLKKHDYGMSYEGLINYAADLDKEHEGRRYAARTINYYLAAAKDRVKALLSACDGNLTVAEKYQIEKAIGEIKSKKIDSQAVDEEKILSCDEIKRFIAECPHVKIELMVEFMWKTAVRVSEMLGILYSDLKRLNAHYEVRIRGKGSKERFIGVTADLVNRIKKEFDGKKYLFKSSHKKPYSAAYVSMTIKRQGRRILDRDISAHTFRHSAATYTYKKTGRITAVQHLLGHSNVSTTLNLYVHDHFSFDELQELFD